MTLRNVPKAHTLEQQRQEINLIASDLDTAVDGTKTFGGSKTFSSDVTFSSTVDFNGTATFNANPTFADSVVANFGDDADLKIYYDGSVGVQTSFIDSDALQIRSATDTSELYATFLKDGPVELYYDGTKQFGTSATGASVLGNLEVSTDITCNSIVNNAGGGATWSLFNTGAATFTDILTVDSIIQANTTFSLFDNGNALFEDVEATSLHMKDDRPAHFGTNEDASLYYDNTSSDLRLDSEVGFHVRWYDSANTQYEDQAVFSPFGSTSFYYQGAATPTLSIDDGVDVRGVVTVGSNTEVGEVRLGVGGSQANYLKIFASSGETYIRNKDNDIGGTATTINIQGRTGVALWQDTGNLGLQVDSNCAVKLYYQTSEKLETTTDGVEITGTLDVTGNTAIGAPDVTNASTGGVQAFASGQLRIQRDGAGDATDKRFQMYYGTSETASITAGGDATFGNLTLSDDTKEIFAQTIHPITTGANSVMTLGGSNLATLQVATDLVIFERQIAFMPYSNAGLLLGGNGQGGLSSNGTNAVFKKYEEGTFTPAIDVSGTSGTLAISYATQSGRYTRIGRMCFCTIDIRLQSFSRGTGTGGIMVTGLPFQPVNSGNFTRGQGSLHLYNWNYGATTAGDAAIATVKQDGTAGFVDIRLHRYGNTDADVSDPSNTSMLFATIAYECT